MAGVVATHRHFPTLVLHSAEELIPERVHSVHWLGDNTFQWCEQPRSVVFTEGNMLDKVERECFF